MRRHSERKTQFFPYLFPYLFTVVAVGATISGGHALAQGAPVSDVSAQAQIANQVQAAQNQLSELTQMKSLAEQQLSSLGEFGTMGDIFSSSAFEQSGSKSDFYSNMQNFAFDYCAINLCTVGDNPVGTTDIEEARDWVKSNFFAADGINNAARRDLGEVRRRSVTYNSVNGLALANVIHNDLAGAGEEADSLEQIVESASSLRGDIRANSAIALASYKVQVQQLATLTSMLGVESSAAIASAQIYHEDGSSEFPDAFIDGDYASTNRDVRTQVTVPEKGSPSGGSGFGGGLAGAVLSGNAGDAVSSVFGDSVGSIVNSDNPADALMAAADIGDIPRPDLSRLNVDDAVSDAVGAVSETLNERGLQGYRSALDDIQRGIVDATPNGNAQTIMGAAKAVARSQGSASLNEAMRVASTTLASGDPARAVDFARGALDDLRSQGMRSGEFVDYIESEIERVRNQEISPRNLVLDSATMLSTFGQDANNAVSRILQMDPEQMTGENAKGLVADALNEIATGTGETDLQALSESIRTLDEQDMQALRQAANQNQQ